MQMAGGCQICRDCGRRHGDHADLTRKCSKLKAADSDEKVAWFTHGSLRLFAGKPEFWDDKSRIACLAATPGRPLETMLMCDDLMICPNAFQAVCMNERLGVSERMGEFASACL